jgi:hypothetical protein
MYILYPKHLQLEKKRKVLPFELYENPSETEEIVQAVILPKIVMQWRIKQLYKLRNKNKNERN